MRGERLYETTRGLTTAVAAGIGGLLLWIATRIGTQTEGRFWAAMGIVAGAGALVAVAQAVTAWAKGLRVRLSPGTFLFAFLPLFVCVAWILLATQPAGGFAEGHIVSWSRSLGLIGLVHDLGLWHGVLAFGLGLVLGLSFDAVPVVAPVEPVPAADEPITAELRAEDSEDTQVRDGSLPGGIMGAPRVSR